MKDKHKKAKKKAKRKERDELFARMSGMNENETGTILVLNLSNVSNWEQLRLVLANTFAFDYEVLNESSDFFLLLTGVLINDTSIHIYGIGKMAEFLPLEASRIRGDFDNLAADSPGRDIEVYYKSSTEYNK